MVKRVKMKSKWRKFRKPQAPMSKKLRKAIKSAKHGRRVPRRLSKNEGFSVMKELQKEAKIVKTKYEISILFLLLAFGTIFPGMSCGLSEAFPHLESEYARFIRRIISGAIIVITVIYAYLCLTHQYEILVNLEMNIVEPCEDPEEYEYSAEKYMQLKREIKEFELWRIINKTIVATVYIANFALIYYLYSFDGLLNSVIFPMRITTKLTSTNDSQLTQ